VTFLCGLLGGVLAGAEVVAIRGVDSVAVGAIVTTRIQSVGLVLNEVMLYSLTSRRDIEMVCSIM